MPLQNRFLPQRYSVEPPEAQYELIAPHAPVKTETGEGRQLMQSLGRKLDEARVRHVVLAHGTLAGTDALGILGHIDQFLPDVARSLGDLRKRIVDSVAGDVGNYSKAYAQEFARSIAVPGRVPSDSERANILVHRFLWSSANHHLGRAWAAVKLLNELLSIELSPHDRILLWGHSHAGNVFAIVSNLLGGSDDDRVRFFTSLPESLPDSDELKGPSDIVRAWLADSAKTRRLAESIDLVTFGTPIRYGWETGGYTRLLHFVNHRPSLGMPAWQAKYPNTVEQIGRALLGEVGDYVQQTFIAGTDFSPSILSRKERRANKALGDLLEPDSRRRDLLTRLQTGPRVAADGTTLLVDYQAAEQTKGEITEENVEIGARHLAGHGVYTTLAWLSFHLGEVVKRLYS